MNAANMVRSLLPLVLICLVIVWWTSFRQSADVQPVREIDPTSTVRPGRRPRELPDRVPRRGWPTGYRPTSARTDAGHAAPRGPGDPADRLRDPVRGVRRVRGQRRPARRPARRRCSTAPQQQGTVDVGGRSWTRSTTRARRDRALPDGRRRDRRGQRLGVGEGAGDGGGRGAAVLRLTGAPTMRRRIRRCVERHDMITSPVRRASTRDAPGLYQVVMFDVRGGSCRRPDGGPLARRTSRPDIGRVRRRLNIATHPAYIRS